MPVPLFAVFIVKNKMFCKLKNSKRRTLLKNNILRNKRYTYNREAAVAYAQTYAEVSNTKEYPLYKGNDCTNFVCQALVAGGMAMVGSDYEKATAWFCYTKEPSTLKKCSLTWRSAEYFRKYWGYNEDSGSYIVKEYKEFTVEEAIDKFDELYEYLIPGDVIQYAGKDKKPYHTQIVTSKEFNIATDKHDIFGAQHSANRKHVSLHQYWRMIKNGKGQYIYIYHF